MQPGDLAPELDVIDWLNAEPMTMAGLRGRVVVVEAFQMLCPGCVSHGLPQAQRVRRAFDPADVVVVGLHTVFEHHHAMGRDALAAFLSEYRVDLPVAVDRHDGGPVPATMARYELRGTPSTVVVDRQGRVRLHAFGVVDDLVLGAELGRLVAQAPDPAPRATAAPAPAAPVCEPGAGCFLTSDVPHPRPSRPCREDPR